MLVKLSGITMTVSSVKQALWTKGASAEWVAALALASMDVLSRDEMLGWRLLNAVRGPWKLSRAKELLVSDRLREAPYLPGSFFIGATKENGYQPVRPLQIEVFHDSKHIGPGYCQVQVRSAGDPAPRLITLRSRAAVWFVWECAGLLNDVDPPG